MSSSVEAHGGWHRARGLLGRWWGAVVVLVAFACVVATGIQGIDFGFHWDEPAQLRLVNQTIRTGSLIPGVYNYPAVTYWLSIGSVLPDVLSRFNSTELVDGEDFYLRTRAVFLVVSSLGGLWIYLALRRRAGELGAAFGGATYLLSFQFAYHARWVAPDAVTASTTALFVLLLVIAWDSPESRLRTYLPAVGAALAAASKYQGAVFIIPVLLMYVARWRANRSSLTRQLKRALASVLVFLATWFVLNPGAALQNGKFLRDVRFINEIYRTGHVSFHGATPTYNVVHPLTYLWRLAQYVFVSLPSQWPLLSIAVVVLAGLGVVTLVRREHWFAAALLTPCVVLSIYFSTLHVFIVRNFLLLLPLLAFFAGVGVGRLRELVRGRIATAALMVAMFAIMIVNAAWLVHAASTISQGLDQTINDTAGYMRDRPGQDFAVSRPLARAFREANEPLPSNARVGGEGDEVLMLLSEVRGDPEARVRRWPGTERGSFHTIGPLEVDFDFYPTWDGDDRVLVFTPDRLRELGLNPG